MKKFEYKTRCRPTTYDSNDEWFEVEHANGWELVSIDYTRTDVNGYSTSKTQFYIFRKEIIEFENKDSI